MKQICPKCNGQGTVSKPPHIDGDVYEWIDNQAGGYKCNLCDGEMMIPLKTRVIERHGNITDK